MDYYFAGPPDPPQFQAFPVIDSRNCMLNNIRQWFQKRRDYFECGGSWFVEHHGKRIALLTDPDAWDMFWTSWHVEPTSGDWAERQVVLTKQFWLDNTDHLVYVSSEYGTKQVGAMAGTSSFERDSCRLDLRWLVPAISPFPWEKRIVRERQQRIDAQGRSNSG